MVFRSHLDSADFFLPNRSPAGSASHSKYAFGYSSCHIIFPLVGSIGTQIGLTG